MGQTFCMFCAIPFLPNVIQGGGCVPIPNPYQICQVENCFLCFLNNQCSYCNPGYVLTNNNFCNKTVCPPSSNCQLCDQDQFFCFLCNEGYIPDGFLGQNCI